MSVICSWLPRELVDQGGRGKGEGGRGKGKGERRKEKGKERKGEGEGGKGKGKGGRGIYQNNSCTVRLLKKKIMKGKPWDKKIEKDPGNEVDCF